jgi:G6PDH family F420-dependent oxidoreductase
MSPSLASHPLRGVFVRTLLGVLIAPADETPEGFRRELGGERFVAIVGAARVHPGPRSRDMAAIGVFLSSEEHGPRELVEQARLAEDAGFDSLLISDHFHPWIDEQGESPFVWSVIGAIAAATRLHVTTGVTCPTVRIHPAIVAQAAATSQLLLDGRFSLGVGSGEALNEHILGDRWPSAPVRLEMLDEAVAVIRELWTGEVVHHRGPHYRVDGARLYSVPDTPPPIVVSAFGPQALALAARIGSGLITTEPDAEAVASYRSEGGRGETCASLKVCWDRSVERATATALRIWPTSALHGPQSQELPMPAHFEQACARVTAEMVTERIACGPDPHLHAAAITAFVDAGFDRIYVNQVGDDWPGFLDFFNAEVRPLLAD